MSDASAWSKLRELENLPEDWDAGVEYNPAPEIFPKSMPGQDIVYPDYEPTLQDSDGNIFPGYQQTITKLYGRELLNGEDHFSGEPTKKSPQGNATNLMNELQIKKGIPIGWTDIRLDHTVPKYIGNRKIGSEKTVRDKFYNTLNGVTAIQGINYSKKDNPHKAVVVVDERTGPQNTAAIADHELDHVAEQMNRGSFVKEYGASDTNITKHRYTDQKGQLYDYEGRSLMKLLNDKLEEINRKQKKKTTGEQR